MATFSDCPGCIMGMHDRHEYHWGKRPEGVIDGNFCGCEGNCKERADQLYKKFHNEQFILRSLCFKPYMTTDGEISHCSGPLEHWGPCNKDWLTKEERIEYGTQYLQQFGE